MVVLLNKTSSVCSLIVTNWVWDLQLNISRIDSPPLVCFGDTALPQTAEKVAKLGQSCDKSSRIFETWLKSSPTFDEKNIGPTGYKIFKWRRWWGFIQLSVLLVCQYWWNWCMIAAQHQPGTYFQLFDSPPPQIDPLLTGKISFEYLVGVENMLMSSLEGCEIPDTPFCVDQ